MKMIKFALLGTAAVAAVSASARADELSDLKAQIEALNARVAQVEAAPAVPAGYSLVKIEEGTATVVPSLDIDKNYSNTATVISIMPTADAPAATSVEISGFARAALVYRNDNWANENFGVRSRGEVKISGKTDTAVGEVGAFVKLRADLGGVNGGFSNPNVTSPEYWGYWNFAEGLTLGGGYTGSLSGIGYGYDGKCNCYYTDNANAGYGHGDTSQMRLSYASGPFSAAIALEDNNTKAVVGNSGSIGVAGEVKYSGDVVSGEISGGWWDDRGPLPLTTSTEASWVGAGVGFDLAEMFNISMSGAMGNDHNIAAVDGFWKANVLAKATLTEGISAEIGYNYFNRQGTTAAQTAAGASVDESAILAGIYYDPVDKLTLGLEAEWINPAGASNTKTQIDFVTVYRF